MDFVTARDLRNNTGAVWEKLKSERELVITLNGRPFALLTGISGQDLEEILKAVRRARAENALKGVWKRSREKGLDRITMKEVDEEIGKYRRDR